MPRNETAAGRGLSFLPLFLGRVSEHLFPFAARPEWIFFPFSLIMLALEYRVFRRTPSVIPFGFHPFRKLVETILCLKKKKKV